MKHESDVKMFDVKPKRDFHILHNEYNIHLKKDKTTSVPEIFKQNLKTEKVI